MICLYNFARFYAPVLCVFSWLAWLLGCLIAELGIFFLLHVRSFVCSFARLFSQEARKKIRAAMKRGPASGDGVVRAATVSSELLLETLRACRSWGELFEVSLTRQRRTEAGYLRRALGWCFFR